MKIIAVTVFLLLALVGGGVVLTGGVGFFVASKFEARAAEFEEAMMAEAARCAPKGWAENMLESQRPLVRELARMAAKMEMAQAYKDKKYSFSDESLEAAVSSVPCPKVERVRGPTSLQRFESDFRHQQANSTSMDRQGWKFGDPVTEVSGTRP